MSQTQSAVDQYLERYAEPEIAIAPEVLREVQSEGQGEVQRRFGHVLTIPATGEGASLRDVLASIPAGTLGEVLVILVVNASADAPDWITDANLALLAEWGTPRRAGRACGALATLFDRPHGALLLIDRASPGRRLPAKQGVGLARKIGADLALALWRAGAIESPWIHCTDADVVLPSDYFEQPLSVANDAAALAYRYRHVGTNAASKDRSLTRAALEYEISLRYYVRGLAHAGSPFAFHTIGSTMAIRADAYAEVRGFPRRLAAEDFYLLNKLSKLGRVELLTGPPIDLSSRISHRVPFGTGRALADASSTQSRRLYHPGVFDYLRVWQTALGEIAKSRDADRRATLRAAEFPTGTDPRTLEAALDAIGELERAPVPARNPQVRLAQLQHAFDAGRTLKLVHALRDLALPSLPLEKAIEVAPFVALPPRNDVAKHGVGLEAADLGAIAVILGRPQ